MHKFYDHIIKPFCQDILINTIGEIVDSHIEDIKVKDKISMPRLCKVLDKIHNGVLKQLFLFDNNTAPDSGADLNDSFDSYEDD